MLSTYTLVSVRQADSLRPHQISFGALTPRDVASGSPAQHGCGGFRILRWGQMFLGPTPEVPGKWDQVEPRRVNALGADGDHKPPKATVRQSAPEVGVDAVAPIRPHHAEGRKSFRCRGRGSSARAEGTDTRHGQVRQMSSMVSTAALPFRRC